jgi:hypothetical protein
MQVALDCVLIIGHMARAHEGRALQHLDLSDDQIMRSIVRKDDTALGCCMIVTPPL